MLIEYYLEAYARAFAQTDREMWNYEDGCVLIGLNALYEATGKERFREAIRAYLERYIGEDGSIRLYNPAEQNLDYIPAGRVLYPMWDETGSAKYRLAIERLMGQLRIQPRTSIGSFWHKGIYPFQVWLDGLYMALPFYSMYEKWFGDGSGFEDVLLQFTNARDTLYDPVQRLYYHAYSEDRSIFWCDPQSGRSANFWTRAIGWHLMAFADVYELMPSGAYRDQLLALWREAMDGVLARRDPDSGLLWQLTALPRIQGNYLETSGSLMVAYSLMKGARLGVWQDENYAQAGLCMLMSVEARMFRLADGCLHLGGICKGAGLGPAGNLRRNGRVEYYLSEAVVEDEQKGVGVCMMALAEAIRLCGGIAGPKVALFMQKYDPIMPEDIAREQAAQRQITGA